MQIKMSNKLKLITYSKDCIAIKKGNDTLISSRDIIYPLRWLNKNGYNQPKNRVSPMLISFNDKDINDYTDSFDTPNYSVSFDGKKEYTINDKTNKNNTRWIYSKRKMIERVYLLEVSRLNSQSIDEIVADIKQLNKEFKQKKDIK